MKLIIMTLLLSSVAWAHSGGTNSSGCHNDRKNGGYHCHKSDDFKAIRKPANTTKKTKTIKKGE
jgi:hypothetical protein